MKPKQTEEISVLQIQQQKVTFRILGNTPIILNRMPEKVRRELLMPKAKENLAARSQRLKHDVQAEFQSSPYRLPPGSPTLLAVLATSFKGAIKGCAVDMPGSTKAQIGRLVHVEGEKVPLYGIPYLHMSVVRQAGMQRTPDVRTRCAVPEWCAQLTIVFTRPIITLENIAHLLAGAGLMQGVGDWRPEKGSGTHGQFRILDDQNKEDVKTFERITKTGAYRAQVEAMENPKPYDTETEELLSWFTPEVARRQFKVAK